VSRYDFGVPPARRPAAIIVTPDPELARIALLEFLIYVLEGIPVTYRMTWMQIKLPRTARILAAKWALE
jgi:hypothetical protein